MSEVPNEYFPIGFRLYRLDPGEDGLLPFQIIAEKKSETGESLMTLSGHTRLVWGALTLTDGRILSWSLDSNLRLWDGDTGESLATFSGHTNQVAGAQILPDGRILSWAGDGTLRLWDATAKTLPATLRSHHTGRPVRVRVLADGRVLSC